MLQAHQRLGDFEVIRLLGKGGMGEVYEARQFNLDRPVALKVLAPWLAFDEEALQRFWREAQVPANLDHPGIVRIITTGKTSDGVAYYAMHLVRGISLAAMIQQVNTTATPGTVSELAASQDTPDQAQGPGGVRGTLSAVAPVVTLAPPLLEDYRRDRYTALARIGGQVARALAYAHRQGYLHRDIKPSNLMVDRLALFRVPPPAKAST
jgi:serine/threonine protein kinase